MRLFAIALALTLIASAAVAQQTATPAPEQMMKTFSTSSDVMALLAKAKADHKEGQTNVLEPILVLAPYRANLEYRTGVGTGSVHEKEAELMYVIDGSGAITIGGKPVEEKRTNAENLSFTSIEGGTVQKVNKGDFLIVPENTPHWFSAINGTLILMTFHVPRTAGAAH